MLTFCLDLTHGPSGPIQRWIEPPGGVIGRDAGCAIRLKLPGISKWHAKLHTTDGWTWTVEDVGSTNGTRLNGRRISSSPTVLPPEGNLDFGENQFFYQLLELQTVDGRTPPLLEPNRPSGTVWLVSPAAPAADPEKAGSLVPDPPRAASGPIAPGVAPELTARARAEDHAGLRAEPTLEVHVEVTEEVPRATPEKAHLEALNLQLEHTQQALRTLQKTYQLQSEKHVRLSQQLIALAERAQRLEKDQRLLENERQEALAQVEQLRRELEARPLPEPKSGDQPPDWKDVAALRPLKQELARLNRENRTLHQRLEAMGAELAALRAQGNAASPSVAAPTAVSAASLVGQPTEPPGLAALGEIAVIPAKAGIQCL